MKRTKRRILADFLYKIADYIREYSKYHKFVNIELRGELTPIDVEILGIVKLLNLWPGIYTISSCQGRPSDPRWSEWTAHVALASDDDSWRTLAEFGFETLKSLEECGVNIQVAKYEESNRLWLNFPYECIQQVERALKKLVPQLEG